MLEVLRSTGKSARLPIEFTFSGIGAEDASSLLTTQQDGNATIYSPRLETTMPKSRLYSACHGVRIDHETTRRRIHYFELPFAPTIRWAIIMLQR